DLYVLPSYYENFPFTLLEAFRMKCACISYNVGAVDEIIDDGINGYLVKVGDFETLVQRVESLLANESLRKDMAERGYLKVRNNFTAQKLAEKTRQAYETILNSGRLAS
ncbi:MAG: glycosyltransferase family 4 protein, partial [candidate division KSB1 bacterium]|nr:glycosyltransferase family 4 protein [candidate division KSB1 bacterium]